MVEVQINTRQLLIDAFGYAGISLYQVPQNKLEANSDSRVVVNTVPEVKNIDGRDKTNLLGLKVFSSLVIEPAEDDKSKHPGMTFDDVLIDISREKKIVETPVSGLDYDVLEHVSSGNFKVSIMGLLVTGQIDKTANRRAAPEKEIRAFAKLMEINAALQVTCKLLEWFGIYSLVVADFDTPNSGSMINVRPFKIDCVSDMPIQLIQNIQKNV